MTFEQQLIADYLRLESIDAVFKEKKFSLPISFAGLARILRKNNIVTTAGPNSHLSESLYFFSLLKDYGGSVAKLQNKLGISVSTKTLHRVLHNIRFGITRRFGAALLMEDKNSPGFYLTAQDQTLKGKLGEKGDWSLPMTHTREQDSHYTSILRVLQREVFLEQTIENRFPTEIMQQNLSPAFSIDITDIKVNVYHIKLDMSRYMFSSFKLSNYQILDGTTINSLKCRPGVKDIIQGLELGTNQAQVSSKLNSELLFLPVRGKIS